MPIVHVLHWQTCGVHVKCFLVPRSSLTPRPLSVQEQVWKCLCVMTSLNSISVLCVCMSSQHEGLRESKVVHLCLMDKSPVASPSPSPDSSPAAALTMASTLPASAA